MNSSYHSFGTGLLLSLSLSGDSAGHERSSVDALDHPNHVCHLGMVMPTEIAVRTAL
jgi:hypothetical protein